MRKAASSLKVQGRHFKQAFGWNVYYMNMKVTMTMQ